MVVQVSFEVDDDNFDSQVEANIFVVIFVLDKVVNYRGLLIVIVVCRIILVSKMDLKVVKVVRVIDHLN